MKFFYTKEHKKCVFEPFHPRNSKYFLNFKFLACDSLANNIKILGNVWLWSSA